MNRSETVVELVKALCQAQGEISPAPKDRENLFTKSFYPTLTAVIMAIKEPLAKNGLSFVQGVIENAPGDKTPYSLETYLFHASGEWIMGVTPLMLDKNNMQGLGSAVTYAKRYSLAALVGVCSDEDDDGNAAVGNGKEQSGPNKKNFQKKVTPQVRDVSSPPPAKVINLPNPPPQDMRAQRRTDQDFNYVTHLFAEGQANGFTEEQIMKLAFEQFKVKNKGELRMFHCQKLVRLIHQIPTDTDQSQPASEADSGPFPFEKKAPTPIDRTKLFGLAKEREWSNDAVKQYMQLAFSVSESKDLNDEQMGMLMETISKAKPAEAINRIQALNAARGLSEKGSAQ